MTTVNRRPFTRSRGHVHMVSRDWRDWYYPVAIPNSDEERSERRALSSRRVDKVNGFYIVQDEVPEQQVDVESDVLAPVLEVEPVEDAPNDLTSSTIYFDENPDASVNYIGDNVSVLSAIDFIE